MSADTRQLGFAFGMKSHPICERCHSSLLPDEPCDECEGTGVVPWEGDDEDAADGGDINYCMTCPECCGDPVCYRCPTCHDAWTLEELRAAGMEDWEGP